MYDYFYLPYVKLFMNIVHLTVQKCETRQRQMALKNLKISVESLLEQEVDEINRDGEEKYIKPFDLSEELTYLAGKIDFYEGIQGHIETPDDESKDENAKENENVQKKDQKDGKSENEWPWSSVHSKLRLALSEMCVMLDVLQTLNKKKFLVLDPIQQNPEQEKQTVQMLEKRKYLAKVGSVIGKGASGLLVKSQPETIIIDAEIKQDSEYYSQLMDLRQFWRVKKSGNQIIGDLSYHSSGSRFWHPGLFEVKAHHKDAEDCSTNEKSLSISISPDLTIESEIVVELIDKNEHSPWKARSITICLGDNFVNTWEKDMSKAQQHLFNKEIFSQLSNDAFQGSFLGIEVLNSQIKCRILGDTEVIISHNVDKNEYVKKAESDEAIETANDLSLLLSALLYQQHRNVSKFTTPYPATSNFYGKQTKSSSIISLTNRKPNDPAVSILQEFLKQTEHKIWVHRVNSYLYDQNKRSQDPVVSFHWNVLKSRLTSVVKVTLSTLYIFRNIELGFLVTINEDGFSIHGEGDVSIELPFDMDGLHLIMQNQLYKQLQSVVDVVCQQHGWSLISSKLQSNMFSPIETFKSPLILRSFQENKIVSLIMNDLENIIVEVSAEAKAYEKLLDTKFQDLQKRRIKVSWKVLPGHSFVEKLQSLLLFS